MRFVLFSLAGVLALVGWGAPTAHAGYPYPYPMRPQAPDACGPGYYAPNDYGALYGPNYDLRPPYPPFNGYVFGPRGPGGPGGPGGAGAGGFPGGPGGGGSPSFPTHPFARSPRDFFMVD
jgi:hypothetical protein